jgi:adenylate kinase
VILFFGPPGSGKSVQGQLLVARNGWSWLSTGQLFRDSGDPEVQARLATGELISDDMTNKLLDDALATVKDKANIVLDGYPRNPAQAKWLTGHLPKHGREIVAVVVFEVSPEELVKRLSGRGRAEDSVEVIERRLKIYEQQTQPVLEYYKQQNVPICTVDGHGSVGAVHDRIQAAVEACALA